MKKMEPGILFRNLLIEIVIYSILIFGYYLLVLRWLDDWLLTIFNTNLVYYAIAGLGIDLHSSSIAGFCHFIPDEIH